MGGRALAGPTARLLQADRIAAWEAHRGGRYARKLATIIWHMLSKDADYIWARPALLARKFRAAELRAGLPIKHAR